MVTFDIGLGVASWNQGIINPGVVASAHLGPDRTDIHIVLPRANGGVDVIAKQIDRRANRNGTVRITGGVVVRDWFRANFRKGDIVEAVILSRNSIALLLP